MSSFYLRLGYFAVFVMLKPTQEADIKRRKADNGTPVTHVNYVIKNVIHIYSLASIQHMNLPLY